MYNPVRATYRILRRMFNALYATYLVLRVAFWRFVLFCAGRRHPSRLHAQWMLFILRDALRREFRKRLN
jgi:hypothetical protein